jgi:soluble lytic murein transglycosylase-like protein
MKKMLDKPTKRVSYFVSMLLFGMIILTGDVSRARTIDKAEGLFEETPISIEVQAKVEQPKVKPALSRGNTEVKPLTERELINTYIRSISAKYDIEPELIMSIIQSESEYNPKAKTGNCLGLMQVSSRWHADRAKKLGVKDFYDPYSNILIGVDYISELLAQYKDKRLVLMLYNMNHNTAMNMYKEGNISYYARTVLARAEQYKKGE